jgi:hypothetical protein
MRKTMTSTLLGATLLATGLAGCAAQDQQHEHPELLQRIQAAEKSASDAQAAAIRAQARADEAAAMASANNDKIDKAFRKSQQK